jgi:integrase
MSRPSQPWFRKQSDSWVSKINGKLCTLAKGKKNKRAALREFRKLIDSGGPVQRSADSDLTIGHLVNLMADDVKGRVGKDRYRFLKLYLPKFLDFIGRQKLASSISPNDVQRFLDKHPDWSRSTRSAIVGALKRVFNWAIDERLLTESPIKTVKRPAYAQRDSCIDAATAAKLIEYFSSRRIGPLVAFLHETGCRPSEAQRLQVEQIDLAARVCRLPGKTTDATGQLRAVYLTPRLAAILAPLTAQYNTGHVFRNRVGNPWNPQSVAQQFAQARKVLGLPDGVTAESFRHAFASDGAFKLSPIVLAKLMGHTSTKMLNRHYVHADKRADQMHAALDSLRGNRIDTVESTAD